MWTIRYADGMRLLPTSPSSRTLAPLCDATGSNIFFDFFWFFLQAKVKSDGRL